MKPIAAVLAVVLFAAAEEPEFFGQQETPPKFGPKIGKSLPYVLPVHHLPDSSYGGISVSSTLE